MTWRWIKQIHAMWNEANSWNAAPKFCVIRKYAAKPWQKSWNFIKVQIYSVWLQITQVESKYWKINCRIWW